MGGTVPRRTQSCAFFRLGCVGADRLGVNLRPDAERHVDARVGMGTRLGARGAGGFDQTAGVGAFSGTPALDLSACRLSKVGAVWLCLPFLLFYPRRPRLTPHLSATR